LHTSLDTLIQHFTEIRNKKKYLFSYYTVAMYKMFVFKTNTFKLLSIFYFYILNDFFHCWLQFNTSTMVYCQSIVSQEICKVFLHGTHSPYKSCLNYYTNVHKCIYTFLNSSVTSWKGTFGINFIILGLWKWILFTDHSFVFLYYNC